MTWHVVTMAGARDAFAPVTAPGDEILVIPFNVPGHPETFGSNTADVFAAQERADPFVDRRGKSWDGHSTVNVPDM